MARSFLSRSLRLGGAMIAGAFLTTIVSRGPAVSARSADIVQLASGSAVHLATPPFLQVGRRYAFTWPGGGPPQTYIVKALSQDGWILVDVADENTNPAFYVPGEFPTRWLHVGLAMSIQEMRPIVPSP
jgi:hypothetical protein